MMTWRAAFSFALVVMIAASIAMAVAAVERSPGWFLNPGAAWFLREVVLALAIYAGVIIVVVANRGDDWDAEMRNAALFGSIAGLVEGLNVALENGIGVSVQGPAMQLAGMLFVFALWAAAGARTARELNRFRPGIIAAVMSAGVCMVIGVTAGFAMELFIAPSRANYVATWAEFKRSGWTDAHAFGIANTLDSGFTHLWMGPLVALVVGSVGAAVGWRMAAHR
ncbi:MAG: hypothetical protein WA354_13930 [Terracidiphilus sp.]